MSTTTVEQFLGTAIESGTTDSGIDWLIQPAKQPVDGINSVDEPPYVGAVRVPEGHPWYGTDGRLDKERIADDLPGDITDEDITDRIARGTGGAEGWIGLNYATRLDEYDGDEVDEVAIMLASLAGIELVKQTKESVIQHTKEFAELVARMNK